MIWKCFLKLKDQVSYRSLFTDQIYFGVGMAICCRSRGRDVKPYTYFRIISQSEGEISGGGLQRG